MESTEQFESEQLSLDEDEVAILEFVGKHEGKTANILVEEMNKEGQCSRVTTIKKMGSLIDRGFLEDRRIKANSFHSLYINNSNQFNQINKALEEVYSLLMETKEIALKIFAPSNKSDYYKHAKILSELAAMYKNTYSNMLETLLIEVNGNIKSPKDSQLLYSKIITLMLEIAKFNRIVNSVLNPLLMDVQMLEAAFKVSLTEKTFRKYAKKNSVELMLFRSYLKKINTYYTNFNKSFPNNNYFLAGVPAMSLEEAKSLPELR